MKKLFDTLFENFDQLYKSDYIWTGIKAVGIAGGTFVLNLVATANQRKGLQDKMTDELVELDKQNKEQKSDAEHK